ncbi:hypothetical protein HY477_00860 [Candidatus Uhrbacteria bacterium]|nr:hypothetical protein [Candidatus Uhrbacteria bacterium]
MRHSLESTSEQPNREIAHKNAEGREGAGIENQEAQRMEVEAALKAATLEHADLLKQQLDLIQLVQETRYIPDNIRAEIDKQLNQLGKDTEVAGNKVIELESRKRALEEEIAKAA